MLLSLCVPVHNRLHDLRLTLPYLLAQAQASPPVEIVILDYGSTDGLAAPAGVVYRRYEAEYFHKAHAFNLAVLAGGGEYCVLLGADAMPQPGYVPALRGLIEQGCVWMRGDRLRGIVCVKRQEFVDAGGYDERFEFYGPEDRDLEARLARRGGKFGLVPDGLMAVIPTGPEDKVRNFRLKLSRREMSRRMRPIFEANEAAGLLVANEGRGWGQWT